jgi:YidC/Oxa1 family membrane protein insertase
VFSGLFDLIAGLLAWFYGIWPSYGMSIVFLTMLVMLVLSPLTISSTRQMIRMQRLQPELKRIQNEFRHDRTRMNEEVMRFYQQNNVNPVGSCLPLLIQMPVFLILFRVLNGLTRRVTDVGFQVGAVSADLSGGSDVQSVSVPKQPFDPDYVSQSTDLYQSLSQRTEMTSWGLDLSATPMDVLRESVISAIPYLLFIVLIGVLAWIQQKQIQGRNKGVTMPAQQQMLMKVLPFMLPIFSFGFPAGLLVYFVVSSLVRIAQQAYITKVVYAKAQKEEPPAPADLGAKGGKGGGKAVTAASTKKGAGDSRSGTTVSNTRSSSAARRRRTNAGAKAQVADAPPDRPTKGAPKSAPSKGAPTGSTATPSRRVTPPGSGTQHKKKRK